MSAVKTTFLVCIILITGAVFFTSCQTEISPYTQRLDSTVTENQLLKYIDGRTGNDTFFISYQYDTQNKWRGSKIYGVQRGDTLRTTVSVLRDASGFVTSVTLIDSTDRSNVTIETETILHNAAGRYTHRISGSTQPGSLKDTTYFVYNNQGKIITTVTRSSGFTDSIPFGYTANNLDTLGIYPVPLGYSTIVLKYDNRVSPARLGNEAFLFNFPLLYGTANVTMFTDYDGPTIHKQALFSYTYNANNNPVRAVMTVLPTNDQYTFNYHY